MPPTTTTTEYIEAAEQLSNVCYNYFQHADDGNKPVTVPAIIARMIWQAVKAYDEAKSAAR